MFTPTTASKGSENSDRVEGLELPAKFKLHVQSASSGQFQGFVKTLHGSSTGRWADTTVAVQPGMKNIAIGR